jgi:hypothetical protein
MQALMNQFRSARAAISARTGPAQPAGFAGLFFLL